MHPKTEQVPEGRLKHRTAGNRFSRPSGTTRILSRDPSNELLGYCRASLWDGDAPFSGMARNLQRVLRSESDQGIELAGHQPGALFCVAVHLQRVLGEYHRVVPLEVLFLEEEYRA
jgi:hypothetical protein